MISFTSGNILESSTNALVNTVNCEGYMGKGIAYQFKLKFPENDRVYREFCNADKLKPGVLLIHQEENKTIVNFPTKDKWRKKSEYQFIVDGLKELAHILQKGTISSISIPPLGCGNGGLDWLKVKSLMVDFLEPVSRDVEILIFEPFSGKINQQKPNSAPKLNTSHLLLMYLKEKLTKFNKLRIQKSAYLINILSGQDYFKFSKNHFGPHAYSIDILSRDIREFQAYYGVTTHEALERSLLTLASDSTLAKLDSFIPYLESVGNLVNSFSDDRELELLATLLFLIEDNREMSLNQLIAEVHGWNEHKRKAFDEHIITDMTEELEKLGIIRMSLLDKYELSSFK